MTRDIRFILARHLADHLGRIMPPSRSDWAAGMAAEIKAVEDPGAALAFAWGCVRTSYLRRLRTLTGVLAAVRLSLGVATMLFAIPVLAAAQTFAALTIPDILPQVTAGIGIAFLIAGLALIGRGSAALAAVASMMLALNTAGLWATGVTDTAYPALLRALALEGCVLWSLLLLAAVTLHGCGRSLRLAKFAEQQGWAG
jgi:hypothetical protein